MKRIIAVICAVAMLLSFACTAQADEWGFLNQQYMSYDATIEFYAQLNKPLECLAALNEEAGMDVQYMVEELCKAKFTAHVQAEIATDAKAAKLYMGVNSNVPLNISEDLKFGTDVTLHVWMEYDFTDAENIKYTLIFKNPLNGKYMYLDLMDEALGVDAEEVKNIVISTYDKLNVEASIKELTELVKTVYSGNATIAKTDDGYTQISFTNDGLIDAAFELVLGLIGTDYMKNVMELSGNDASMLEVDGAEAEQIKTFIKGLGLFAEKDAYTMKFKTNAKGQMTEAEEKMHLQFNAFEFAVAMGEDAELLYPLTKEISDIDATLVAKAVYNKIDEENIVTIPTLTEENSVSLADELGYAEPEYDYELPELEVYQPEYFWDSAKGLMDWNSKYVNLEDFIESCYWDEDNLTGEAFLDDNNVKFTLTSDNFGTVTVTGNLRSDEYMLNDIKLWGRRPFKVVSEYNWDEYTGEEKLYVSMDVLEYILGAKVQSIQAYILDDDMKELTNPEYYFEIVRPNPAHVAPVEQ